MMFNNINTQLDDMIKSLNNDVIDKQRDQLDMKAIYDTAVKLVNDPDITIDDTIFRWDHNMISDDLFHCYLHLYKILFCIDIEDKYFPKE